MGLRPLPALCVLASVLWLVIIGALGGGKLLDPSGGFASDVFWPVTILAVGALALPLLVGALIVWTRRRALRGPFERGERVVADGWANRRGTGGWLVLTDQALIFRGKPSLQATRWPLSRIAGVEGSGPTSRFLPGLLRLSMVDWSQVRLVVFESTAWEQAMARVRGIGDPAAKPEGATPER